MDRAASQKRRRPPARSRERRRPPPGQAPRTPAVVTRSDAILASWDSAPVVCAERTVLAAPRPRAWPMRPTGASCPGLAAVLTSRGRLALVAVVFASATLRFDGDGS